jgi:hypothetical protein
MSAIFLVVAILPLWCGSAFAATLRLAWQDTSSNESGFKIERLSGSNYVEIASVGPDVQTYSDTTLAPGTNYCYRVRAFNSAGISAPTNAGCATTLTVSGGGSTPPPPPPPPPSPTGPSNPPTPPTVPPISSPSTASAWKDYQLRATLRSTDNDAFGVMFRYQEANNY